MASCNISFRATQKLRENGTPDSVLSRFNELWSDLGLVNQVYLGKKIEEIVVGSSKQIAISIRSDEEDGAVAAEIVDLLDGYVWYYTRPNKITDATHYICTIVNRILPLF